MKPCKWLTIGMLAAVAAAGATVRLITLFYFTGSPTPHSGLTQITGGDYLAGMTSPDSIGRFTPQGALSTFYTFASDGSQGSGPNALVQSSDGILYGTCASGGSYSDGTIFQLTLDGQFTLLHTFQGPDGRIPSGKLVEGDDGAFYGVTQFGGPSDAGTVFRITASGQFTSLFAFNGGTTGDNVNGGLILASDGNFWGTTYAGGTSPTGIGTVFKISAQGVFTSVYSLNGYDGYLPFGPVLERSDGNFYGTATAGGSYDFGVVYRLTPAGAYTVMASFNDSNNGSNPFGTLVEASDGNLYGITDLEYYYLGGTAFQLTASNQLNTLASFGQGDQVFDGLLASEGGGLRGMTDLKLFSIRLGLRDPKPVITGFHPASGHAGTRVTIRGDHFIYANQVLFNGVPAKFVVTSANFIQAVAPAGATTGPISIQNAGGTTASRGKFTVTPQQ